MTAAQRKQDSYLKRYVKRRLYKLKPCYSWTPVNSQRRDAEHCSDMLTGTSIIDQVARHIQSLQHFKGQHWVMSTLRA